MRFSLIAASIAVVISFTCIQDVSAKGTRLNRRKVDAAIEKRAGAAGCPDPNNPSCPKPVDVFSMLGVGGVDLSNTASVIPPLSLPNAQTTVAGLTTGTMGTVTGALPLGQQGGAGSD